MGYEYEFEYKDLTAYVTLKVIKEKNYGADADGNRGAPAYFVELGEFAVYGPGSVRIDDRKQIGLMLSLFERDHYDRACDEAIEALEDRNLYT